MRFSFMPAFKNRTVNRLLDQLTDDQVSVLITGDCRHLSYECLCRSAERFELFRLGIADVHGRLTPLGLRVQANLQRW